MDDSGNDASAFSFNSAESAELAGRLTALARLGDQGGAEWIAIQEELAKRRIRDTPHPSAPTPSLRSQVLRRLRVAPGSTPTQLAAALDRSTTVVSRVLANLLASGVVTHDADPDDLRVRHYRLVAAGDEGQPAALAPPAPDEAKQQILALGIAGAVRARRRGNALDYANDRLARLLAEAEAVGADDLALLARRELITTLRQAGRREEAAEHRHVLEQIERGVVDIAPQLVLPAIGSVAYELGRDEDSPARERLDHLTAAASAFRKCQELTSAHDWCPREGWALLTSAEIWREQTEFGVAQSLATRAAAVFEVYDDTYGAAEAARTQGFCHRLRGDFQAAISTLHRASALASKAVSERCQADVLAQLGDSYRCAGELDLAREFLSESEGIARRLDRSVALGFILSSLAAVEFSSHNLDVAQSLASDAERYLSGYTVGSALNTRRRAVIARELASGGDHTLAGSTELFQEALNRYRDLASPAGEAACLVGLGQLPSAEHADAAVSELLAVASSSDGRLLLPIDPWVPSLVDQWARATDIADVARVADWTFRNDLQWTQASEMAGEPRIVSSLLAA